MGEYVKTTESAALKAARLEKRDAFTTADASVVPETTLNAIVKEARGRGDLRGMSFGFEVAEDEYQGADSITVRTLETLSLSKNVDIDNYSRLGYQNPATLTTRCLSLGSILFSL